MFISFCFVSSSIYCINDLKDAEADRQHPKKCHRPIASGKVTVKGGYTMMAICMIGAFALLPFAKSINTPYLYIIIGGLVVDVWVSHWLVLMTFLVTLFLALSKRNDDYRIYEQTGIKPRVSISGYNKTFINEATAIVGAVTLVLRYLQNTIVFGLSSSPTKSLVKDHFIQFCILGWLASFFVIIYL